MHRALICGLALAAFAGCRGPAVVAPSRSTAPSTKPPVKPPPVRAGFVIYTIDDTGAGSTWMVPYSLGDALTTEPALQLAGWWVQDDEPARVTAWNHGESERSVPLSEAMAALLWDARCPVGRAVEGACTWPPRQVVTGFNADGGVLEQRVDGQTCACFELPVADRAVLLAGKFWTLDELADGASRDEDDEESCELAYHFVDSTVTAFFGGVMQSFKLYNDLTCDGTRATDVSVERDPLANRTALPRAGVTNRFCSATLDPQEIDWTLPSGFEEPVDDEPAADEQENGDEEAECAMDGEFWSVRRGHLVRTEVGANVWTTCVCHASTPVNPKQCPSAADPCGSAAGFPGLLGSTAEFWIGADERAALVLGEEPTILAAGGRLRAPLDAGLLPKDDRSRRILGVRHHRSIDPLVRASAAEVEDPALDWLPVALRWPSAIAAPALALAPADRNRGDRRGGRDWGNRCFAHFKAGRLDAAEAACARGLSVATDETIRGAIHHSLGRIAEARGHVEAAIVHYRTSLALRPDDSTEERFVDLLVESR